MEEASKREKIIGIEIFRIATMFLIVVLHTLNQGGALAQAMITDRGIYMCLLFLETLAGVAVNCYGLISGFVGINSRFKASKLLKIWLQVFFYCVLISFIFSVFNIGEVNRNMWIKSLFPLTSRVYWYISCYFGLLILMPVINAGLKQFSEKQINALLVGIVIVFSVYPFLVKLYPINVWEASDPYSIVGGYSLIWLLLLYICGACIRISKIYEKLNGLIILLIYVADLIITWLADAYMPMLTMKRFGEERYQTLILAYNSPLILIMALCLLVLFTKIKVNAKWLEKLILTMSAATLGIYIIHTNPNIWDGYIFNFASAYVNSNVLMSVLKVLSASICIFIICMIIDILRNVLFKLAGINKLYSFVDEKTTIEK